MMTKGGDSMSDKLSFERLDFHMDKNAKLINKAKPFVVRSTSVYVPLESITQKPSNSIDIVDNSTEDSHKR